MSENFAMNFPDHPPSFMPSPSPAPFAADTDAIGAWSQFQISNEQFDPHSQYEQAPSFKRARTSETIPINSRMHPPNPINKGTSHIFFKTRMCAKFKMGMCRNGENCNFAHGIQDVRQPPPNWQELIGMRDEVRSSGNWDDDQKIIHKMKLCKKYYNGEECPYGDRCNFLHEDPAKFRDDSGRYRESSAISIGTNESPKSQGNGSINSDSNRLMNAGLDVQSNVKSAFWKTKLCIKWETTGQCGFGDKCHFAHGQQELQVPVGRIETEATSSILVASKSTSVPANDAIPCNTAAIPSVSNEEEQGKKSLLKWKGPKKINRIYADWLDDVPLVHNLPRKVET
ncbi:hypothetical protein L6164_011370 [Bauhinia variegata]|uniref:Uncharacterized protein n=1 Tax=Bauhinia variegata TaxID=167791 RepID=A0ACB9P6G4_BAUVA|nr:hypothetical protein L6164_011370 [Bauhinia variegata]